MKITIYTITDCAFSKQEKEYLSAHGLQFEEKNLETNREFLTEMLAVGSNFAGTPVTKIEKDDGQIAVLKGFTAAEFDKTLGLAQPATPAAVAVPITLPTVEQPAAPTPIVEVPIVPTPAPEVAQPAAPAPQAPATTDPVMASLLNNLEQQAQVPPAPVTSPVQAPVVPAAPQPNAPVIPDPQF